MDRERSEHCILHRREAPWIANEVSIASCITSLNFEP